MIAILVFIGIGVVFWWLSKGLKKLSAWLAVPSSQSAPDPIKIKAQSHKKILQQNKIAEEQLQSITGESSHAAYQHNVRLEIEELIKQVNTNA